MDNLDSDNLVFSSKTRVFRVLAVDEARIGPAPRSSGRAGERPSGQDSAEFWLSPPMQDAIDAWVATQPDPKPGRAEAVRRLLNKALTQGS